MATVLDITILDSLTPVFVFLFVFVLMFTILEKLKVLGSNKGLNSLVAFSIAMLFLISAPAIEFVKVVTPWFVVMLMVIMSFIVVFMFMGIKAEDIASSVGQPGHVWTILILLLILLGAAMTFVFGTDIAELTKDGDDEGNFGSNIWKILFHPRMLGVAFLLLVASQTVRLVGQGFT